jgi:hypothetical protein
MQVNGAQNVANHSAVSTKATAAGDVRSSTAAEADTSGQITISVEGVIVNPAYRSTPWEAEARREKAAEDKVGQFYLWGGLSLQNLSEPLKTSQNLSAPEGISTRRDLDVLLIISQMV